MSSFAVIKTGGKQYRVSEGDVIAVERLQHAAGDALELDEVLMIGGEAGTTVGTPRVAGASVSVEVVDQVRGDKIIIFKKKRRKGYRRRNGHRQHHTLLKVTGIRGA